jgi:hypothetical protein
LKIHTKKYITYSNLRPVVLFADKIENIPKLNLAKFDVVERLDSLENQNKISQILNLLIL